MKVKALTPIQYSGTRREIGDVFDARGDGPRMVERGHAEAVAEPKPTPPPITAPKKKVTKKKTGKRKGS